jgi:hypothetical protein
MYAHPAVSEETLRRGIHRHGSQPGREMEDLADREGQVMVIADAWMRRSEKRSEKRVAASAAIRSPTVRWADAVSDRDRIVPTPWPLSERTFV